MATSQRQPYKGDETKLVIAIDVGTTFSGVSYALLDPGKVPHIQPVTRFIGQQEPAGNSKVPSIVCYDQDGNVVAAGAETDPGTNSVLAEMDSVFRVEWFKLHLRPPHLAPSQEFELQKLRAFPKNTTPVRVLGDFLRYLFRSTKEYIMESEQEWSWDSIESNIYFVLSHPNGWEGKQQSHMRKAAIAAGLVNNSEALERVSFISEGEASLHFCLNKNPSLRGERDGILVVDCGGGTIDVSAYSQTVKGSFEEVTTPECFFQGSVFVTCHAQEYLKRRLRNSRFGSEDDVDAMVKGFEKAKCAFNGPDTPYYVKFGRMRDNDPQFDIRSGSIKIPGVEIANFFEPALQAIVQVIVAQHKSAVSIKHVLLVGGFAKSNYLFSRLKPYCDSHGINIFRADTTHLNKAVADGAVSYYLDHYVSARVAKYFYGLEIHPLFDLMDPEHVRRENLKFMHLDGKFYVSGIFSMILKKGICVADDAQFRQPYSQLFAPEELQRLYKLKLKSYRGQAANPPVWLDLEPDNFYDACDLRADLANVKTDLTLGYNGAKPFYMFKFEIVIFFGRTELEGYIAWRENGVEKRSRASVVYDD